MPRSLSLAELRLRVVQIDPPESAIHATVSGQV